MKTFSDMLKDLLENEELRLEAKKALRSEKLTVTEEQYCEVVAFGQAHGYDFTEEDIHLYRATNRALDDNELALVTGAGHSDYCNCDVMEHCEGDVYCYSDYRCSENQKTSHGGNGHCILDYACMQSWNSCNIIDECAQETKCHPNSY